MKPRDENALETHDEHIQQWCLCGLAHKTSVLLTSNLDFEFALIVSVADWGSRVSTTMADLDAGLGRCYGQTPEEIRRMVVWTRPRLLRRALTTF